MTLEDLMRLAIENVLNPDGSTVSSRMVLVGRFPKGFPRGEFLAEDHRGVVKSYDPLLILAWIRAQQNKIDQDGDQNACVS
jgi:hypothetical protein